MIVDRVKGDVFESAHAHIVFAVNAEGVNDSGFAGVVAQKVWPELAYIGACQLGSLLSLRRDDMTYHALVCHSLARNGWCDAPALIANALDALDIPEGETIAIVAIGAGPVGQAMGADTKAIREAIDRSTKHVTVYSL